MTAQLPSKERLQEIIDVDARCNPEVRALARFALAAHEQEPVAKVDNIGVCWYADGGIVRKPPVGTELFTQPAPAPAVPKTIPDDVYDILSKACGDNACLFADELWNACRASTLRNSPVIPDGYVLVPIEPTENMVVEGFESEPDKFFSEPEVWKAYQEMSGCGQAAHRARLCWAAMIAAVPKEA